jgi:sarcosine oxidase subunit delta
MDFRFGGEVLTRPGEDSSHERWTQYYYFRKNIDGYRREWWYHKFGCRKWFYAVRDTRNNHVLHTFWPEDLLAQVPDRQTEV